MRFSTSELLFQTPTPSGMTDPKVDVYDPTEVHSQVLMKLLCLCSSTKEGSFGAISSEALILMMDAC